jgi:membrane protease YdiL (CAAX protease family)
LNRQQFALTLHAIAIISVLAFALPALVEAFGTRNGILLALPLYWLGFSLPVITIHVWPQRGDLFTERLAWRNWWVPLLLLVQVLAVAAILFVPHTAMLTTHAAMLAAIIGLINAPLEETAWRGGFLRVFADKPRLGFWLAWVLSSAMHVPLLLSASLALGIAWPILVAVAALLGLFWGWLVWRTGSVFWTSMAHGFTDILALWVLLDHTALR